MKIHSILLSIFFIAIILSCKEKNVTPEMKLTKVYVESGSIDVANKTFNSKGSFKAADTAIGMIDSSCAKNKLNGFVDVSNLVYVFEGGKIPSKILKLSGYNLFVAFKTASWVTDFSYTVPFMAQICKNSPFFYYREPGLYPRQKATIKGITVYRMYLPLLIEDYTAFMEQHNTIVSKTSGINLYDALKINATNYTIQVSRADLKVDAQTGVIDFSNSKPTPIGTMDKIVFRPINKGITYRLRVVYVIHDNDVIKKFFGDNPKIPKDKDTWKQYLADIVIPKYKETEIIGYECNDCLYKRLQDGEPPLPIMENGPFN